MYVGTHASTKTAHRKTKRLLCRNYPNQWIEVGSLLQNAVINFVFCLCLYFLVCISKEIILTQFLTYLKITFSVFTAISNQSISIIIIEAKYSLFVHTTVFSHL